MRWKTMLIVLVVIGMVGFAGCSGNIDDINLDDQLDNNDNTTETNMDTSDAKPWSPAFGVPLIPSTGVESVQTYREVHRNHDHEKGFEASKEGKEAAEDRANTMKSDGLDDEFESVIRNGDSFEAVAVIQSNAKPHEDVVRASNGDGDPAVTSHVVNYRFTGDYLYSAENTSINPTQVTRSGVEPVELATEGHIAEEYSPVGENGGFPRTQIRYTELDSGETALATSQVAYRNQYLYQSEMNAPYDDIHSPVQYILKQGNQFNYEGFTTEFPGAEGEWVYHYSFDGLDNAPRNNEWIQLLHSHGITSTNGYDYPPDAVEGDVFVSEDGKVVGMSYSFVKTADSVGGAVLIDYKNESEMTDVDQYNTWKKADNNDYASPVWVFNKDKMMNAGSAKVMVDRDTYKEVKTNFNREISGGYVFAPSYPRSEAQAGHIDFTVSPGDRINIAYNEGVVSVSENGAPSIEHDFDKGDIGPVVILDEDGTPVYWGTLR